MKSRIVLLIGITFLLFLCLAAPLVADEVRPIRTLTGSTDSVSSVTFSPDGRSLASGSWDDTIKLWDVGTGSLIRTLKGHTNYVYSLSFSPDGRSLASGSWDHTIKLWDVGTGDLIRTLSGHTDWVWSVAFSPDGRTLASGAGDSTVKLWDVGMGSLLRTLTGHTDYVRSVSFSPDGRSLASGSNDKTIKLWDVGTGSLLRTLTGHTDYVRSVSFSPDGRSLASGSNDKTIKLWDVGTGDLIRTLTGHRGNVRSVSFSPDGRSLASGSNDKTIKLWDVETGKCVRTFTDHTDWVNSVAFSPDGKLLASGSADQTIKLWDVNAILHPNKPPVAHFTFSPQDPTVEDEVQFTDKSFTQGGEVKTWQWDFGDGTSGFGILVRHTYHREGTYKVTLTVIDNGNLTANKYKWITVREANQPPTAQFTTYTLSPTGTRLLVQPRLGDRVWFDASESSDLDGTITKYEWDWNSDGTYDASSTDPVIGHVFTQPGDHKVTLQVTDDKGATSQISATVTVKGSQNCRNVWAVVVGISDYLDAGVLNLMYARADAEAFYTWLLKQYPIPSDQVRILTGAQATLAGIREALEWVRNNAKFGDVVIFYFGGQGTRVTDTNSDEADGLDECIVPYDATLEALDTSCLRDDEIRVWIDSLLAKKLVLIADTLGARGLFDINSGTIVASSSEVEASYESPKLQHGVFTYFLLRGLGFTELPNVEGMPTATAAEADSDNDGIVTAREMEAYLKEKVSEYTHQESNRDQDPLVVAAPSMEEQPLFPICTGESNPPQASFTFSPTSPSILDTVQFTDTSTDSDGQVVKWEWDFGDGSSSTAANPSHKYAQKKTYTVKLTVTGDDGLTDAITKQLTVVNLAPTAAFSFSPQQAYINQPISFDASPSTDNDGTIANYAWEFGDGSTATGKTASHLFTKEGSYTVKLTVTDDDGDTASHEEDLTVNATPPGPPKFKDEWGLVVGIADYKDPSINDLQFTEDDAQAFYNFLVDRHEGGFSKDHVRLLLGKDATLIGMRKGLDWLKVAGPDDLVVFYFAGHGTVVPDTNHDEGPGDNQDECLVPYDADRDSLTATTLVDDAIGYWFSNLSSQHVLMVFDSCFSGGASRPARTFSKSGSRAAANNQVFTDMAGAGRLFLAASQADQSSYEYSELGHGVFTYFLLRGLGDKDLPEVSGLSQVTKREADKDGDGTVTVEEMEEYLNKKVPPYVRQHEGGGNQTPVVRGDENLRNIRLDGYGVPLVGEVTAIDGEHVIISLGSKQGIQPGDRFQVIRPLTLPDGTIVNEVEATIEVLYILGPDRAGCKIVKQEFPVQIHDRVQPVNETGT